MQLTNSEFLKKKEEQIQAPNMYQIQQTKGLCFKLLKSFMFPPNSCTHHTEQRVTTDEQQKSVGWFPRPHSVWHFGLQTVRTLVDSKCLLPGLSCPLVPLWKGSVAFIGFWASTGFSSVLHLGKHPSFFQVLSPEVHQHFS